MKLIGKRESGALVASGLRRQNLSPVILERARGLAERCPSLEVLLARVNPDVSLSGRKRAGSVPTLMTLNVAYENAEAGVAWLVPRLVRLSEYCGTREKFSRVQLDVLAHDIMRLASYLDLGEVDDFFERYRTGEFGRLYGQDDPMSVAVGLREYLKKRRVEVDREQTAREAAERERQAAERMTFDAFVREVECTGDSELRAEYERVMDRLRADGVLGYGDANE